MTPKTSIVAALLCVCLGACTTIGTPVESHVSSSARAQAPGLAVTGTETIGGRMAKASWYGPGFHGRRTASGERFNSQAMTAAHRTLPFGTKVRVHNPSNGKSVVVRINDRGPFHRGREIDLSHGAARAIGLTRSGVGTVTMVVLDPSRSYS